MKRCCCCAAAAAAALAVLSRLGPCDAAVATESTASVAVLESVAAPPVNFAAEVTEPKLVVAVEAGTPASPLPAPVVEAEAEVLGAQGRALDMVDDAGQHYRCLIPSDASGGAGEGGDGAGDAEGGSGGAAKGAKGRAPREKPVGELLDALGSKCFYRIEGWWTYEFCYRKKVRQFHQEKDTVTNEFVLGLWDADATAKLHAVSGELTEEQTTGATAKRYHPQTYTNGTACDLTNELRSTEVRFTCTDGTNSFIEGIKEPATCSYVLYFATPHVCRHSAFAVVEQPVSHIRCTAYTPEGETPTDAAREQQAAAEAAAATADADRQKQQEANKALKAARVAAADRARKVAEASTRKGRGNEAEAEDEDEEDGQEKEGGKERASGARDEL